MTSPKSKFRLDWLRFSPVLGVAIALGLCAGNAEAIGTVVAGQFQVAITPDNNLSDLYLLFDSGDHQEAISLGPASAPAGVTTNFYLPFTIPFCSPGTYSPAECGPYVGVVAVNTDESPSGLDVGVAPSQATIIFNLPFTDSNCSSGAFPGFCSFANPDSLVAEAALVDSLENPTGTNAYSLGLSGSQVAGAFANAAQPDLVLFNFFTNSASLTLVKFSISHPAGSVEIHFSPRTPEPATMGLLAAGFLLLGYRRLTSRS